MIPAPNVMLIGPTGAGKTTALRSIARMGIELCVLFTEPHMEMVMVPLLPHEAALGLSPIDPSRVHYRYIPPRAAGWAAQLHKADTIMRTPWDAVMKQTNDPQKHLYTGWFDLLSACANFRCDHCGTELGDVTEWDHTRALAVEGLSGINVMALQAICGGAVARSQPQFGAAMATELEVFGQKLANETRCLYVLVAHIRRVFEEATGTRLVQPHVLGQANIADWPKAFNDVIAARRLGERFLWSTADPEIDTKATNVSMSNDLTPDFGPLMNEWWRRVNV